MAVSRTQDCTLTLVHFHHDDCLSRFAVTLGARFNMRAYYQWSSRVPDSHHVSVEVIAFGGTMAIYTDNAMSIFSYRNSKPRLDA